MELKQNTNTIRKYYCSLGRSSNTKWFARTYGHLMEDYNEYAKRGTYNGFHIFYPSLTVKEIGTGYFLQFTREQMVTFMENPGKAIREAILEDLKAVEAETLRREQLTTFPIGKYKDKPIKDVLKDYKYCVWLLQQEWFKKNYPNQYKTINDNTTIQ